MGPRTTCQDIEHQGQERYEPARVAGTLVLVTGPGAGSAAAGEQPGAGGVGRGVHVGAAGGQIGTEDKPAARYA
jgi:hypothetical protein